VHVFLAELGALGYIDQILAVHRIHSGGVWSALGAGVKLGHVLKFYDAMSAYLGPAYSDLIEAARLDCATNLLLEGDVRKESLTNQRTASAILKQWQQELGLPREYVYKALARYCAASIFTGTVCGPKETLSAMMGILRGDASWLSNRGLWSMAWAAATRGQARSHER
jgi:hypothetical protein